MSISYEGLKVPQATALQNQLREQINVNERILHIDTIAGADISLNLYSTTVYAGILVLSFPQLQPLAYALVKAETRFPYVPGYLAFREVPALLSAWEILQKKPDVLVVDGHGIAHPRRMGIATHFGVVSGQATLGCAKKMLFGDWTEPAPEKGSFAPIKNKEETLGYAFRSKAKTAPVFVSPGHNIGLQNTLDIIRQCTGNYRIPEPTRLAHELVNRFRRGELQEGAHTL